MQDISSSSSDVSSLDPWKTNSTRLFPISFRYPQGGKNNWNSKHAKDIILAKVFFYLPLTQFFYFYPLQILLPMPANCPREIYDLMCECWQRNDSSRPNFREIHLFLQRKNLGYKHGNYWFSCAVHTSLSHSRWWVARRKEVKEEDGEGVGEEDSQF